MATGKRTSPDARPRGLCRQRHAPRSYSRDKKAAVRKALADTICSAVDIHATLEEEIFYPVMRGLDGDDPVMRKSTPEHDDMRRVIGQLRGTDASDQIAKDTAVGFSGSTAAMVVGVASALFAVRALRRKYA